MFADRRSAEYEEGVERFLQFGFKNGIQPNSMRCPCVKCGNVVNQPILEILITSILMASIKVTKHGYGMVKNVQVRHQLVKVPIQKKFI